MVIAQEKKLVRDMTRSISLYELLNEHVIDVRWGTPKIGKFKLDETDTVFESG